MNQLLSLNRPITAEAERSVNEVKLDKLHDEQQTDAPQQWRSIGLTLTSADCLVTAFKVVMRKLHLLL